MPAQSKFNVLAMAIAAMMCLIATTARATELKFVWSNNGTGNAETFFLNTATFTVDPFQNFPNDYIEAPIFDDSAGETAVYFGNQAVGGGFGTGNFRTVAPYGVSDVYYNYLASGKFFTGPNSSPTLAFGPGTVYHDMDGATLTISAVPEPAVWAEMLIGFFGTGTLLRRRKRLVAIQA